METPAEQIVISVRGEAVIEVEPEVAMLSVEVAARAKDRREALESLEARRRAVSATVDARGRAVERIDAGPVYAEPEFKENKPAAGREKVAGYRAAASFRITVVDFTVLGALVAEFADSPMTVLSGPWWQLRPESPVHEQARVAAARDALARARSYARAFDGRIVGLLQLADRGLLEESHEGFRPHRAMALSSAGGFDEDAGFDLQPVRQTVRGQVEARFAMTAPELGDRD